MDCWVVDVCVDVVFFYLCYEFGVCDCQLFEWQCDQEYVLVVVFEFGDGQVDVEFCGCVVVECGEICVCECVVLCGEVFEVWQLVEVDVCGDVGQVVFVVEYVVVYFVEVGVCDVLQLVFLCEYCFVFVVQYECVVFDCCQVFVCVEVE